MTLLNNDVLVLNKCWIPINIRNVLRSLLLVCNDKAHIVDSTTHEIYDWDRWISLRPSDDEDKIRCVNFSIKIPEIIVLNDYSKIPKNRVAFNRNNVYTRDNFTCQYCGVKYLSDQLSIDHVIPRSRLGKSNFENCVAACLKCNRRKASKTPDEANMPLLNTPVIPKFLNKPLIDHAIKKGLISSNCAASDGVNASVH